VSTDPRQDPLDTLVPSARTVPRGARLRVGLGAAALLVVLAAAIAAFVALFATPGHDATVPPVTVSEAPTAAPTREAVLFVHVLGAVRSPGLYELHQGARVMDAVGAAGGFADDAEPAGVNLARPLADGEQLIVPHVGETQPPAPPAGSVGTGAAGGASTGAKINLNSADQTELETLPQVGPALASRIIAWRTENGGFTTIDDLLNVTGIGQKTFDGLKELVTV
jgi:competence protein ComEA